MAENWCSEHNVAFFKKGGMRGYAHPIQDENGEDTGEWCNEDAKEVAKLEPQEAVTPPLQKDEPTPEQLKPFDPTRTSIERQTSLKSAIEWCIAKVQSGEKLKTFDVLVVAKVFESYLDTGVVVEKKK